LYVLLEKESQLYFRQVCKSIRIVKFFQANVLCEQQQLQTADA